MSLFLPGVPEKHVRDRLSKAGGNELDSGKFASPESSAALAVNTFGWFVERPHLLPVLPGMPLEEWMPSSVEVEYCARFPWSGGRHPWLDAFVETEHRVIGIESKRYEPFRDQKTVAFSSAYSRPVWGKEMLPWESMRDALKTGEECLRYLDGAQLVKHAFGLVTEAGRKQKRASLVYLFAEPLNLAGRPIPHSAREQHRVELARFTAKVSGAAVAFLSCSYREWLSLWPDSVAELQDHKKALVDSFHP
jgi:hypothetical protein